ncbi:MAG: glycosyltransferase family 39 protein [Chloroflexota bacterium]|nr:glycosyltransferase family 39 protein [Chloroflexota bacterium]
MSIGNWSLVIGNWSLIIILLCAVAVAPLLRADSPCTHDGGLHYYRVVAMRHALQDGSLFTRYLPDLAFGYGYPFFNYRAPLSYYLALLFYLTGLSLPAALNGVYVLSIAGSALAAYLLARDLFGHRAGLVAAIAYAYVPYQFLDALLRANMPESVALPLMPLVLWAFRRLALTGQKRWFLAAIASLSALLLTHNISSLLFAPLLFAYLAVLWLVYRRNFHWMTVGIALALAFGLTAFFWGPALLEQDYVQLHMSRTTRNNDFHYNFVTLAEIFAPPAPVDTSLMNPPMRIHLGLAQAALAAAGLIVGILKSQIPNPKSQERRANLIFFAVSAGFLIFMSTRASLWLWERVPLLPFVQFPWRLVGRAALPVALLASVPFAASTLANSQTCKLASCLLPLASCFLILTAFPSTYPPHGYCPNAPYPAIDDLFAYERTSKLVGVDPEGSYFPVWVKERPVASPLEAQYGAAGPVARFDEAALPTGGFVVESDYGVNQARLVVESPAPFRARYLAFYFPGWRVTVDGEPVPVAPTDPDGLIAFDLPAGRHTVTVRFGETPLRLTADVISLLSLALLLVLLTLHVSRLTPHVSRLTPHVSRFTSHVSRFTFYVLTAIILLAAKLAIVDRADTIFRRPALQPDGSLPGVEHSLNRSYAGGLTLIGYDQNQAEIPADGTLRLDLYWSAVARPTARYQAVIHLVGPDGLRWSQPDSFRPRDYADHPPTTTWDPGRYALDSHEVEPLPGTPPGDYDILLTLFDRATLSPLSVLNEQGQPAAPTLVLGQVTLTRPRRPAELPQENRIDLPMMDLALLTADFDRDQAAPGSSVYLTLMWHAIRDGDNGPSSNQCFQTLTLLSPDGAVAAGYSLPLPVHSWQKGDVWRSQHQLLLPATLETGNYTWTVEWSSLSSDPIGQISIIAPSHTFTAPPVDVETDTRLGDIATLLGATCELANLQPGTPLTVTLVWRAEETPSASYHVFLHLLDAEGELVAQSDSIPANWTRPTTGWLPGEYITGAHTLAIPPDAPAGEYALLAGLYLPGGERLVTPSGDVAISLATFQIEAP